MKFHFQNEGHLYASCLFYIQTFYLKCLVYELFSWGIRMHIPILTGVHNGRISRQKTMFFCWKMFFLKIISHDEGHLHANFFFYIVTVYLKCLLFQFFSRSIYMYTPILIGFKMDAQSKLLVLYSLFGLTCLFFSS